MTAETLVIGVGYLGQRFCDKAKGGAHGLSRPGLDLDHPERISLELPQDYKVLYTVPPSRESASDMRLERLLAALVPAPRRFVYISTTGVYGDHRGATVNEDTPVNPGSEHAVRRVAAESALQDWATGCGCDVVILRVPGIYGPGRLGIERIRDASPTVREEDVGPGNRIHVDDLVTCCAAALDERTPAGVYNVGDGDHRTSAWFTREVARLAGLPEPPTITMEEAREQFTPMRLSFLRDQRRVDTTKMRKVLGVTPRYPDAADGIEASLQS